MAEPTHIAELRAGTARANRAIRQRDKLKLEIQSLEAEVAMLVKKLTEKKHTRITKFSNADLICEIARRFKVKL